MNIAADTLDDLLHKVYSRLLASKVQTIATRGPFVEKTGVLLHLRNPLARLSHTETKGKVYSAIGEFLWYLSRSNRLRFISHYVPQYKQESNDGKTIYGAYGPRLFAKRQRSGDGNPINQIANVIALLKKSDTSRRAVIQLFDAFDIDPSGYSNGERHRDIPCTLTIQFLVRRARLNAFVTMRSNDAFFGLPHDVFCFTMLQELVARSLGFRVGTYKHFVGSLHLYSEQIELARRYLKEGWQPTLEAEMPEMPRSKLRSQIKTVLRAESRIRNGGIVDADTLELAGYWMDFVRLLQVYSYSKTKGNSRQIAKLRKGMDSRVFDSFISRKQGPVPPEAAAPQLQLNFPSSD